MPTEASIEVFKLPHVRAGALFAVVVFLSPGCSSTEIPSVPDSGTELALFRCDNPGGACNSHDPCARSAVCGQDGWCHPEGHYTCDDGLDCTIDECAGSGRCRFVPKEDTCLLSVGAAKPQCYARGDAHPDIQCRICDPDRTALEWSDANGGFCDDGDECTKGDFCELGICRGQPYASECDTDGLRCTAPGCDGQGGCIKPQPVALGCVIDEVCWGDGDLDLSACNACDPSVSTRHWTPRKDACNIGGQCFADGDRPPDPDAGKCLICRPDQSTTEWVRRDDTCLIRTSAKLGTTRCYAPGEQDENSCGVCDPGLTGEQFVPPAGKCLIRGRCYDEGTRTVCGSCRPADDDLTAMLWWTADEEIDRTDIAFEDDTHGFTVEAPVASGAGWQVVSGQRAHGGSGALYFGDPATRSLSGAEDAGAGPLLPASGIAESTFTLAAGPAALQFWLYLDAWQLDDRDVLTVRLVAEDDAEIDIWKKDHSGLDLTLGTEEYRVWVPIQVDISAWSGQDVTLQFIFDTVLPAGSGYEGVYIDDVSVLSGCS